MSRLSSHLAVKLAREGWVVVAELCTHELLSAFFLLPFVLASQFTSLGFVFPVPLQFHLSRSRGLSACCGSGARMCGEGLFWLRYCEVTNSLTHTRARLWDVGRRKQKDGSSRNFAIFFSLGGQTPVVLVHSTEEKGERERENIYMRMCA